MAEVNHEYSISGIAPALNLDRLLDPFAGQETVTVAGDQQSSFPRVLLLSLGLSGVLWAAILVPLFLLA